MPHLLRELKSLPAKQLRSRGFWMSKLPRLLKRIRDSDWKLKLKLLKSRDKHRRLQLLNRQDSKLKRLLREQDLPPKLRQQD